MDPIAKKAQRKQMRWSVRAADRVAAAWITVGGIGTILAVVGVFTFLLVVVIPLFTPGSGRRATTVVAPATGPEPIGHGLDEYRTTAWRFYRDGRVIGYRIDTGEVLAEHRIAPAGSLSAWSFSPVGDDVALGFSDGSVRLGRIGFSSDFPTAADLPEASIGLAPGDRFSSADAVVQVMPEGQFRRQRLVVEGGERVSVGADTAIALLHHHATDDGILIAALTVSGDLRVVSAERSKNLLTGEIDFEISKGAIPANSWTIHGRPVRVVISQSGGDVFVFQSDGWVARFDTRDLSTARLAGEYRLGPPSAGADSTISSVELLLGGATFLVGRSDGRVESWFRHGGKQRFSRVREFGPGPAPVTVIATARRSRVFAVGYADGSISAYQATSGAKVIDLPGAAMEGARDERGVTSVSALVVSPKDDGLLSASGETLSLWDVDFGHPEVTLASLFRPVWYEGYEKPSHVWQSSSGTDDFEPKFGLWPLVFGTLKATLYSMLFAVPLALLAAIYTSEFLSAATRPVIKTSIEAMASLPSVVLGFLAALVFAPFVQRVVPAVVAGVFVVPAVYVTAAYLWQLLPVRVAPGLERFRLPIYFALVPVGVGASALIGPRVEGALFAGDLKAWLSGGPGGSFGGWFVMILPAVAVSVTLVLARGLDPRFRSLVATGGRGRAAVFDLARFASGAFATLAVAAALAGALMVAGADPRSGGRLVGTYVQRNALVVGFVMGFAVIPIIYTIAEDALSAVPGHLRAASLGAGATPWQTAIRIVLPAAMSGLFSAVMIGLGRAVGETMIVLMAAGNTPVMELNVFNGFRTLSANIAVELPEAVRNSTHYRTLFLAALLLFVMTFAVNTVAEIVRLRFRKRSAQI